MINLMNQTTASNLVICTPICLVALDTEKMTISVTEVPRTITMSRMDTSAKASAGANAMKK